MTQLQMNLELDPPQSKDNSFITLGKKELPFQLANKNYIITAVPVITLYLNTNRPTSSVSYWWLSKVARPIYFAYNIGFVSCNCYELQSENKCQQNAVSYPQKQMPLLIYKMLLIHKNKSFSYFFKDKHTKLHEIGTHKNTCSNSSLYFYQCCKRNI